MRDGCSCVVIQVLAALIRRHGPCGLAAAQRADHFSALVRAITGQQLSTKAAATIYGRMVALMPGGVPTVEGFARVADEAAARGRHEPAEDRLPARSVREDLDARARPRTRSTRCPDEEVIDALVKVKGIGRWSAEMFLIFRLHRPDVLPVGDLGIVDRRAAGVWPAHAAEAGAAAQDWRGVAAVPVRRVLVSVAQPRQRARPARPSLPRPPKSA